jgi:hypothetical protein
MLTLLMRLRLRIERKQELLPVVSRTLPTTIGSCLGSGFWGLKLNENGAKKNIICVACLS